MMTNEVIDAVADAVMPDHTVQEGSLEEDVVTE
jgi:hypothetical protein